VSGDFGGYFMDFDAAARALATHPDYRLLRRIPSVAEWVLPAASGATRRAVFLDVETTGLDERDEVIELALLPFEYDRDTGVITRILQSEAYCGLRQPSFPIPPESARVHGITDADVAGKVIDEERIRSILSSAQLVIAHNAGLDRPMVEKHWPIFETASFACSWHDIAWSDEGLATGKLDYLLMRQGWFFDSHRALGDAAAGVFLLTLALPTSGTLAMQALLTSARRPLMAVRAEGTAFEAKAALKQRGYRWDPGDTERTKAWWILTEDAEAEIAWLNAEIYTTPRTIRPVSVPATRRFSSRVWRAGA
jgi:DNA polymerase-3 subunit epsilon